MIKTTLREIKGSLGRYLAILAIVMLGVGFFAGLRVTKPAMIATENIYLQEQNFFDFELLSTIGFTEDDAVSLEGMEQTAAAEGAISVDVLCAVEDGNESIYKIHTLPEQINQVVLLSGRMPGKADECLMDSALYGEDILGSQVTITENNEEDTLEMFGERTYTIVGLAQSPLYINFERGTTSIGEGKITGFFYVPKAAFTCDYLTEIYLTAVQKYDVYTDAYEDYIDAIQDVVEDRTAELVEQRYQEIIGETQEKIDDAAKELQDKKTEAEEELNDAWQTIQDGEEELANGEQEVLDAEEELAGHEEELADGRLEIGRVRETLDAQELELDGQEAQLLAMDGSMPPEIYQGSILQIQVGREQLAAAREEVAAKEQELADAETKLSQAREDLEEAKEELEEAREELAEANEEYADAQTEFEEEVADAQKKIDDAQAELDDIEEPTHYVLTRNTNAGYVCYESDASIVEAISRVFPLFFFMVAALICMTTMNRMVEEQRTQIGVLKALGYGNAAIMGKYLFYAGSAALIGAIGGIAGGVWLFPKVIWQGYRIMYNMGGIDYYFSFLLAALSVAAALLCALGSAYFSCRHELYSVPAKLIRPKAPKNGKRIFLERITFLWSRMKFLHKVSIRNIVRYKKRFFMMILGITGCTALLVTGLGLRDSVANIADLQYEEIQIYDIGIAFSDPVSEADMELLQEETAEVFEKIAYRYEESVDIDFGGMTKSLYLEVPKSAEDIHVFLNLHTQQGEPIPYPGEGEAVITAKIADIMGIKAGDRITLRDGDMHNFTVTVSGICENFVYNYIYIHPDTYERQLGMEPEYKSAYVTVKEGKNLHEAAASIADRKNVLNVSVTQDTKERIAKMMNGMDYIVALVIVCAGCLAFIVLYNLTNINITERIREIATIKVLGFYAKETADYVFRENLVLTGMGAAVGLLLGKWLHWFVMYNVNIDMISFRTFIAPISYVLSLVFTFAFALLVNGIMFFKLAKINMAESLKSIE